MYREGLLILSIVLIIIGVVFGFIPLPAIGLIGTVMFWVGIILFVIWIVLFAIQYVKSGK